MDLYQELILDHSKRKVGHGLREGHVAEVHHVNPTCGDEVTLRVHLDGTGQGSREGTLGHDPEAPHGGRLTEWRHRARRAAPGVLSRVGPW